MANKQEVFEVLTMLAAAYPRYKLVKETIQAYSILLQDLDPEELRTAAMDCASKRDFYPSVHELRQAVVEIRRQTNRVPTAYEAWSQVLAAGTGSRKVVEEGQEGWIIVEKKYLFSHPLVEQVARMLGWPASFPGGDTEMADRAHFLKAYDQQARDAMNHEITLPEVRAYIEKSQAKQLGEGPKNAPPSDQGGQDAS